MFYLSKEGEMMFWGGEYQRNVNHLQQRRAAQFNSHVINPRNARGGVGGGGAAGNTGSSSGGGSSGSESPGKRIMNMSSANMNALASQPNNPDEPVLDFRVISGAALRAK